MRKSDIIYVESEGNSMKETPLTKEELETLDRLLTKLKNLRVQEYEEEGYDLNDYEPEEIYEMDDGDRLLEGLDIVIGVVEDIRGI